MPAPNNSKKSSGFYGLERKHLPGIYVSNAIEIARDLQKIMPDKSIAELHGLLAVALGIGTRNAQGHAIGKNDFLDFFEKAAAGETLTEEQSKRWAVLAHPANLDLPKDQRALNQWAFLHDLFMGVTQTFERSYRLRLTPPIEADSMLKGFLATALPPSQMRHLIHALGLTPEVIGPGASVESRRKAAGDMMDLLSHMYLPPHVVQPSPQDEADQEKRKANYEMFIQFLMGLTVDDLPKTGVSVLDRAAVAAIDRVIEEALRDTVNTYSALTLPDVKGLFTLDPLNIDVARMLAVKVVIDMEKKKAQAAPIPPSVIYDFLFEGDANKKKSDPILYAWLSKLSRENDGIEVSLVEAWKKVPQEAKPKNEAVILKVLAQIDNEKLPLYSVDHVLTVMGGSPSKAAHYRMRLLEVLEGQNLSSLWRETGTGHKADGELKAIAGAFGFKDPKDFIAPPTRPEPASNGQQQGNGSTPAKDPSKASSYKDDELAEAALRVLREVQGKQPDHGDVKALRAAAGKRGSVYAESQGGRKMRDVPSLPHIWIMWAVRPETRDLGFKEMLVAFNQFWEVTSKRPEYENTLRQQFAWAAVAAMKDKDTGQFFGSHQRFLGHLTNKAKKQNAEAMAGIGAPSFDEAMDVFEHPIVKAKGEVTGRLGDRDKAKVATLGRWLEGITTAGSSVFSDVPQGRAFVTRLKDLAAA